MSLDKRKLLEENDNYRLDEKDGKYFRYRFHPGNEPVQKRIFHSYGESKRDEEYRIWLIPHAPSRHFEFEENKQGSKENQRKDSNQEGVRRPEIFWINHVKENHKIKVVVEQRSHPDEKGDMLSPHLNWKGESDENIKCTECRRYFKDLIKHFEIEFNHIDEHLKRIDWDKTTNKFREEIRKSDFFKQNNIEEYGA